MYDVAIVSDQRPGAARPEPLVPGSQLYSLLGGVVLAIRQIPATGAARHLLLPVADGAPISGASASLVTERRDGAAMALVAFAWPAGREPQGLALRTGDGPELALDVLRPEPLDPAALLADFDAGARARIVRFLIELPQSAFPRINGRAFAALSRDLLRAAGARGVALAPVAAAHDDLLLWSGQVPAGYAGALTVALIAPDRVLAKAQPPLVLPARRGAASIHLMAETFAQGALAAIFAPAGIAVARIAPAMAAPLRLLEWLERDRAVPERLREYVAACLAARAAREPEAAAALAELTLFKPLARRRLAAPEQPVGGAVELAVGCGKGLFVSGWVRDPYEVVEELATVDALGHPRSIDFRALRFARPDVEQRYAKSRHLLADPRSGFAAWLPGPAPLGAQHRFELRLRSGARIALVAPPAPNDPALARNAVLSAIPVGALTPDALARLVGPAASALHAQHLARRRAPEVTVFGTMPRRPRASIIVPLYRNLDFLRFQLAAFAADRDLREVELIYVLDSPEQREQVAHLLEGLHMLYGLPLKLVVMSGNFGYAAANNAGAQEATGRLLLLLNSDVVPAGQGWLAALMAPFADDAVGAAGAKLLFDDGSLQHAGLMFRRHRDGRWFNDHFFKGMPRDFPAARVARAVPAVTGAAVMVPRALFAQVGGFTEDYVIGDYEDSDLCLKLRAAGKSVLYVPQAELYHFERKSIQRHAGYMRGVASEYNGWLHAQRWDAAIAALMAEYAPAPHARAAREAVRA